MDYSCIALASSEARRPLGEEGLEALQVVMIIAIAAVILVAAGTVGQSVVDFTKTKLNALKDKQVNG